MLGISLFQLIGYVSQKHIKDTKAGRTIFISIGVPTLYKKKNYTVWFNNIMLMGSMVEWADKQIDIGTLVFFSGSISTQKNKNFVTTYYNVKEFRVLRHSDNQEQEIRDTPDIPEIEDDEIPY